MKCPYCTNINNKVIDSRLSKDGHTIRRRRECLECRKRYTTYERVEKTARLMVVKKDGSRVPFEVDSVIKGLQAACGKRPVPEQAKMRIAQEVEEAVHREFDREVPSHEIGRRVAARLREVDHIAYIRYASEYHEFRTLDEFAEEVRDLQAHPKDLPNQRGLFVTDEK